MTSLLALYSKTMYGGSQVRRCDNRILENFDEEANEMLQRVLVMN